MKNLILLSTLLTLLPATRGAERLQTFREKDIVKELSGDKNITNIVVGGVVYNSTYIRPKVSQIFITNYVAVSETVPICHKEKCEEKHQKSIKELGTISMQTVVSFNYEGTEYSVPVKVSSEKEGSVWRNRCEPYQVHPTDLSMIHIYSATNVWRNIIGQ